MIFRLGRLLSNAKGRGIISVFCPVDRMVRMSVRQEEFEVRPVLNELETRRELAYALSQRDFV